MQKIVRFGIIGCGAHARKSFIPALAKSNCAELTVIASRYENKARGYAKEYGCDYVASYEELAVHPEVDAIYIATPNGMHANNIKLAAEGGKHVLCEKPLTESLETTIKSVEYCRLHNVALMEGFAYQYHQKHQVFQELLDSGEIGEPVLFHAKFGFPPLKSSYRYDPVLGGGALLDAGAYTVHSARKILQSEPINVFAVLNNKNKEVDIQGSVLLEFRDKKTAQLAFGFDNYYQNTYSVWGSKGKATVYRAFSSPHELVSAILVETQEGSKEIEVEPCDQFMREIEIFVGGIYNESEKNAWYKDAINQAEVLHNIRLYSR